MILSTLIALTALAPAPPPAAGAMPETVAVHDVDEARGIADCARVAGIVGTPRCAVLPPPAGTPGPGVLISIYCDDLPAAVNQAGAILTAYDGGATVSIRPAAEAPPGPYPLMPVVRVPGAAN